MKNIIVTVPKLTRNEKRILLELAMGIPREQIAKNVGVSYSNVEKQITELRIMFNAVNTFNLIYKVTKVGLI